MTNEQIIWDERCKLMDENIISGTGNTIQVIDKNGNNVTLAEPEPIHTYQGWRQEGRQVKKGEHAIANFEIWKHVTKPSKKKDEPDEERMFKTRAYFFSEAQTDEIKQ